MERQLSEQELFRRQALGELRALGVDPYPAAEVPVSHHAADILSGYAANPEGYAEVCVAGRLMAKRIMGKASFASVQDSTGRIQVYVNRDEICPGDDKALYNDVFKKHLDLGDFVAFYGHVFTTQTGEISVHATRFEVLSKSLRPLPTVKKDADGTVYDAFSDPELRYRQRYVDLVVNEGVRDVFVARTKIFSTMRRIFNEAGYLEVETPHRIPANAPEPHIDAVASGACALHSSPELAMKRLLAAGYEQLFQICRVWRNGERGQFHLPEFTLLEWYRVGIDYNALMNECMELLFVLLPKGFKLAEALLQIQGFKRFEALGFVGFGVGCHVIFRIGLKNRF